MRKALLVSLSEERLGELAVLGCALCWGTFAVFGKASVDRLETLWVAALQFIIASIVLALPGLLNARRYASELLDLRRELFFAILLCGVVFHGCLYFALERTSANNVAILATLEVLFTFIIFRLILGERQHPEQIKGACVIVIGAWIVSIGDASPDGMEALLLVLLAVILVPFGYHFQKRIMQRVPGYLYLFARSLVASLFFSIWALARHGLPSSEACVAALPYLLAGGIVSLGGAALFFLESLKRLTVPKACALGNGYPAATILFAYVFLNVTPSLYQILGFIFILSGVRVVVARSRFSQVANA